MTTLRSSQEHYEDVQRIVALAVAGSRRAWGRLDLNRLDDSFARTVGPEMFMVVSGAQVAVAELADPYVDAVLAEQNFGDADQRGRVVPSAFAGVASDGRSLPGLLRSPLTDVKSRVAGGVAPEQARVLATARLDRMVWTQVADTNRAAESAAIASRAKVGGYVRQLNPPSCSRCAILAGKWFRYNQGFQRHPQCDCTHVPAAEDAAGDLVTNPRDYFDSLSPAQQDRIFTKSGAQAIRDGADMNQVVNARRGMRSVAQDARNSAWGEGPVRRTFGAQTTIEGVTPRARAVTAPGSTVARRRGVRLMPESIYEVATSRADAVRLLRANGYIT